MHRPSSLYCAGGCRTLVRFLHGIPAEGRGTSAGTGFGVGVELSVVTTLGGVSAMDTAICASDIPLCCVLEGI